MIVEQTVFAVTPGSERDFELAIDRAREIMARAQGFISQTLHRGIEQPGTYLLLTEWTTLEDHMVGFRGSELFAQVLTLIRPYLASPPKVEHFTTPHLRADLS
jgi:heme-degrading monooxygenase HmoA